MLLRTLTFTGVLVAALTSQALPQAQAQEWDRRPHREGPPPGPGWEERHYHHPHWQEGHWVQAWRDGRNGWWWVIGDEWYFYPAPVYPYPEPPGYAPPPPPQTYQSAPSSSSGGIDKTTGGTILGGATGALVGSQFGHGSGNVAAIAAGTLLGAFIGHEVGASLDRADSLAAQQAEQQAYQAPIGQSISWNNPQSGHYGSIVPVRDGTDSSGAYCREFQQTVVINGQTQQAYGTSCRQPDGSWKITQ